MSSKAEAIQIHDAVQKRALSIAFSFKLLQQLFFGSGPEDKERVGERLAVMREVGRDFFLIVKEALVDSVFLGLAVLGDPVSSGKHENLSVQRLLQAFVAAAAADTTLQPKLDDARAATDAFLKAIEPIRPHRNKRIAHADLETGLKISNKLNGVPVPTLRAAVEAAFDVLNTVGVALTGSQMAYDMPIMQGCGESVVDALQRSERAIKLEHWLWTQDMKEMTALELRQEILSRFLSRP